MHPFYLAWGKLIVSNIALLQCIGWWKIIKLVRESGTWMLCACLTTQGLTSSTPFKHMVHQFAFTLLRGTMTPLLLPSMGPVSLLPHSYDHPPSHCGMFLNKHQTPTSHHQESSNSMIDRHGGSMITPGLTSTPKPSLLHWRKPCNLVMPCHVYSDILSLLLHWQSSPPLTKWRSTMDSIVISFCKMMHQNLCRPFLPCLVQAHS